MNNNTQKNYSKMMEEKPLIKCDSSTKLKHGQLIGFKAFGEQREITASYPVWSQIGNEIQFVLFTRKDGRPCIDNTWLQEGNDIYTNDPAIIVDVPVDNPTTFQNELSQYF